jgi:hypothetical protein
MQCVSSLFGMHELKSMNISEQLAYGVCANRGCTRQDEPSCQAAVCCENKCYYWHCWTYPAFKRNPNHLFLLPFPLLDDRYHYHSLLNGDIETLLTSPHYINIHLNFVTFLSAYTKFSSFQHKKQSHLSLRNGCTTWLPNLNATLPKCKMIL